MGKAADLNAAMSSEVENYGFTDAEMKVYDEIFGPLQEDPKEQLSAATRIPRTHFRSLLDELLSRSATDRELLVFESMLPSGGDALPFGDLMRLGLGPRLPVATGPHRSLRQLFEPAMARLQVACIQATEEQRMHSIAAQLRKREQAQADRDLGRLMALTQQSTEGCAEGPQARGVVANGLKREMAALCAVVSNSHAAAKRARSARRRSEALTAVVELLRKLGDCSDEELREAQSEAVKGEEEAATQAGAIRDNVNQILAAKKRLSMAEGAVSARKAARVEDDAEIETELATAEQLMEEALAAAPGRKQTKSLLVCAKARKWAVSTLLNKAPSKAEVDVLTATIGEEATTLSLQEHENSVAEQTFKAASKQLYHTVGALSYLGKLKQKENPEANEESSAWLKTKEALRYAMAEVVFLEGAADGCARANLSKSAAHSELEWINDFSMGLRTKKHGVVVALLDAQQAELEASISQDSNLQLARTGSGLQLHEDDKVKKTAQLAVVKHLRAVLVREDPHDEDQRAAPFETALLNLRTRAALQEATSTAEAEQCCEMANLYNAAKRPLDGALLQARSACSSSPGKFKRLALKVKAQLSGAKESLYTGALMEQRATSQAIAAVKSALQQLENPAVRQQLVSNADEWVDQTVAAAAVAAQSAVRGANEDESLANQAEKRCRYLELAVDHVTNDLPDEKLLLEAFSKKSASAKDDPEGISEVREEWACGQDALTEVRGKQLILVGCSGDISESCITQWQLELKSICGQLEAKKVLSESRSVRYTEAGNTLERLTAALVVGAKLKVGVTNTDQTAHLKYKLKKHSMRSLANGSAKLGSSAARVRLAGAMGAVSALQLLKRSCGAEDDASLWQRTVGASGTAALTSELSRVIHDQEAKVTSWKAKTDYVAAEKAVRDKVHLEGMLIKYQSAMVFAQGNFSGDQLQDLLSRYVSEESTLVQSYESKISEHRTQKRGLKLWQAGYSCLSSLQHLRSCFNDNSPSAAHGKAVTSLLGP